MIRALSAPVDIATDASPLAQDRPALLSAQPALSTSLWAHLLEDVAHRRAPLPVVADERPLVCTGDVDLIWSKMPADHRNLKVLPVPLGHMHQHM